MDLGAFSVSLSVKEMPASRAFYAKLGFAVIGGDGEHWTIMANGSTVLGLFAGKFEGNMLTFNPGWEGLGEPVAAFTDVRELSRQLAPPASNATPTQRPTPRQGRPASRSPIPTET